MNHTLDDVKNSIPSTWFPLQYKKHPCFGRLLHKPTEQSPIMEQVNLENSYTSTPHQFEFLLFLHKKFKAIYSEYF